jgi:acetylornithine deacetylase/succinyl-diaminopimelate desuccinylase-like protein
MKSAILRLCPLSLVVMSAAVDSAAQGAASLGIEYRLEEFSFARFSGTNIVVDLPGENAEKTFLLGAHYDRVPVGEGAVDNAASCAGAA